MAAQKVYGVSAAAWVTAMDGKGNVTIDEVTKLAPILRGDFVGETFDADIYPTLGYVENTEEGLQLTGKNFSLLAGTDALELGDSGYLTVKMPQRATVGANLTSDTCLQLKMGYNADPEQLDGCRVSKIDNSAGQTASGEKTMEFKAISRDGVTSAMSYSMTTFSY
jgi:hypothetical protein